MYYGRKKGIIIGIVVAIVIILLAAISAFVVLKTDLFKSNETLFWKYAGAGLESFEQTPNIQLEEIEKLKMQSPYVIQGELQIGAEETDSSQNVKLVINAENDKPNEYSHVNSKIEYANDTIFDLDYVKNDNVYALKSNEIVTAYLGVKNENLKVLFQKLGVQETTNIPDEIIPNDYSEILEFSEIDLEHIKEIYAEAITKPLTSENYSKQTKAILEKDGTSYETTSYRLDINKEQIVSILQNILTTLKSDSITLNLIIEKMKLLGMTEDEITIEDLTDAIDEAIEELTQEEFEDISFVVYSYKGETIAAEIIVRNTGKATIYAEKNSKKVIYESYEEEKIIVELINNVTTTQSNIQLKMNINDETQVNIDLINTGSASQKSLNTTCEISVINEENEIKATYNQTMEFLEELEETITLDETNSVVLNDYNAQDLKALIEAIVTRTSEVIGQKMQLIVSKIAPDIYKRANEAKQMYDEIARQEEEQLTNNEQRANELLNQL